MSTIIGGVFGLFFAVAFFSVYEAMYLLNDRQNREKDTTRRTFPAWVITIKILIALICIMTAYNIAVVYYLLALSFIFLSHNHLRVLKGLTFVLLRCLKYSVPLVIFYGTYFDLTLFICAFIPAIFDYHRYLREKEIVYARYLLFFVAFACVLATSNIILNWSDEAPSIFFLFISQVVLILCKNKKFILRYST